mmetsp:Transcript_10374/g.30798  ORF Transcript_10374/g.30798 Transcript_10374/m.30798 type:complete len:1222 (+) Transcript_10374:115-3780(+)
MMLNILKDDIDGLKTRIERDRKQEAVRQNEKQVRYKQIRVLLFIILIFVLHFVAFRGASNVEAFGTELTSVELVGVSFFIGLIIWWVMLLPVYCKLRVSSDLGAHMEKVVHRAKSRDNSNMGDASSSIVGSQDDSFRARQALRRRARPADSLLQLTVRFMATVFRLYDTQEYWVARLLRLVFYCLAYVISTYGMHTRDANGQWDFSDVPPFFIVINYISLWTTFFDYTLEVLSGGWAYVISMGSLVELVTQPPAILIVTVLIRALSSVPREDVLGELADSSAYKADTLGGMWQLSRLSSDPAFYLLQFGFLRFLSVYRVNALTLRKMDVKSIKIRVASLGLAVSCIFLIIAGGMFTLEARLTGDDTFVNYFDFFYYAVVTGSTVGYGDFSPRTPLSRLVCVLAIVATIIWIPDQVSKLQEAFAERRTSWGTRPGPGEPYVLLCGEVTDWQLRIFLRNYVRLLKQDDHVPPERVVVLANSGVDQFKLSAIGRYASRRLFVYEGDLLSSLELGTQNRDSPISLRDAKHVFVYGASGQFDASKKTADDSRTVLRVLALLNFVPPWAVTCLVQGSAHLAMATNVGVQNVLCMRDIEMRLLGKSVTDTPGIITLVANLLISGSEFGSEDRNQAFVLGEDIAADLVDTIGDVDDGPGEDARSAPASVVDEGTSVNSGQQRARASLNPFARANTNTGDRDRSLYRSNHDDDRGEYLLGAEAQLLVQPLPSWCVGKPADMLYQRVQAVDGIQLLAVRDGDSMFIWRPQVVVTRNMRGVWITRSYRALERFIGLPNEPPPTPSSTHMPHRARLFAETPPPQPSARKLSATEFQAMRRGDRVLIVGAPPDLQHLLAIVFDELRPSADLVHVRHLAPVPYATPHLLERYARARNAPRGSPPRYAFELGDPLDPEVLKRHVLAPGLSAVIIFSEGLRAEGPGDRKDAVVCATTISTMLPKASAVRVLVSLSSTADVRFVERSSWWPSSDDVVSGHLTSPTYASGCIYADEMMFPLMMGWNKDGLVAFCRGLTDALLDPVEIKLVDLPEGLRAKARPPAARRQRTPVGPSSPLKRSARSLAPKLRPMPTPQSPHVVSDDTEGLLLYEELRLEMLKQGMLPLGLYRVRRTTKDNRVLGMLPYVFTNPPNTLVIRDDDRVFALLNSRAAATPSAGGINGDATHSSHQIEDATRKLQAAYRRWRQADWSGRRRQYLVRQGMVDPGHMRTCGMEIFKW